MSTETREFKVGDKITIENIFCRHTYTIIRVGKKFAVADLNNGSGGTLRFNKTYRYFPDGDCMVESSPRIRFDQNKYKVHPVE